jgi:hypothetical protein
MRLLIGAGRPRGAAAHVRVFLCLVYTDQAVALILIATSSDGFATWVAVVADSPA